MLKIVNNEFNRANYADSIGRIVSEPLGMCKELNTFDPIHNKVTGTRMRFVRMADSTFAICADNDGKELPDYWHIEQLRAM